MLYITVLVLKIYWNVSVFHDEYIAYIINV